MAIMAGLKHRSQVTGYYCFLLILKEPFTNTNLKPKHCLSEVFRPKVSIRKGLKLFQYW